MHHKRSSPVVGGLIDTCMTSIDRLKNGPVDQKIERWIKDFTESKYNLWNLHFVDTTFYHSSALYWWWTENIWKILQMEFMIRSSKLKWKQLYNLMSAPRLFNELNESSKDTKSIFGWYDEIIQGNIENCYLIAALSGVGKELERIKDLFVTENANKAGIYQVKLFLRGKPWVITVDDLVLFSQEHGNMTFTTYNDEKPSMWGPLIEKAWAKMNANYFQSANGFSF